jgi:hypothetical protein
VLAVKAGTNAGAQYILEAEQVNTWCVLETEEMVVWVGHKRSQILFFVVIVVLFYFVAYCS